MDSLPATDRWRRWQDVAGSYKCNSGVMQDTQDTDRRPEMPLFYHHLAISGLSIDHMTSDKLFDPHDCERITPETARVGGGCALLGFAFMSEPGQDMKTTSAPLHTAMQATAGAHGERTTPPDAPAILTTSHSTRAFLPFKKPPTLNSEATDGTASLHQSSSTLNMPNTPVDASGAQQLAAAGMQATPAAVQLLTAPCDEPSVSAQPGAVSATPAACSTPSPYPTLHVLLPETPCPFPSRETPTAPAPGFPAAGTPDTPPCDMPGTAAHATSACNSFGPGQHRPSCPQCAAPMVLSPAGPVPLGLWGLAPGSGAASGSEATSQTAPAAAGGAGSSSHFHACIIPGLRAIPAIRAPPADPYRHSDSCTSSHMPNALAWSCGQCCRLPSRFLEEIGGGRLSSGGLGCGLGDESSLWGSPVSGGGGSGNSGTGGALLARGASYHGAMFGGGAMERVTGYRPSNLGAPSPRAATPATTVLTPTETKPLAAGGVGTEVLSSPCEADVAARPDAAVAAAAVAAHAAGLRALLQEPGCGSTGPTSALSSAAAPVQPRPAARHPFGRLGEGRSRSGRFGVLGARGADGRGNSGRAAQGVLLALRALLHTGSSGRSSGGQIDRSSGAGGSLYSFGRGRASRGSTGSRSSVPRVSSGRSSAPQWSVKGEGRLEASSGAVSDGEVDVGDMCPEVHDISLGAGEGEDMAMVGGSSRMGEDGVGSGVGSEPQGAEQVRLLAAPGTAAGGGGGSCSTDGAHHLPAPAPTATPVLRAPVLRLRVKVPAPADVARSPFNSSLAAAGPGVVTSPRSVTGVGGGVGARFSAGGAPGQLSAAPSENNRFAHAVAQAVAALGSNRIGRSSTGGYSSGASLPICGSDAVSGSASMSASAAHRGALSPLAESGTLAARARASAPDPASAEPAARPATSSSGALVLMGGKDATASAGAAAAADAQSGRVDLAALQLAHGGDGAVQIRVAAVAAGPARTEIPSAATAPAAATVAAAVIAAALKPGPAATAVVVAAVAASEGRVAGAREEGALPAPAPAPAALPPAPAAPAPPPTRPKSADFLLGLGQGASAGGSSSHGGSSAGGGSKGREGRKSGGSAGGGRGRTHRASWLACLFPHEEDM